MFLYVAGEMSRGIMLASIRKIESGTIEQSIRSSEGFTLEFNSSELPAAGTSDIS